MPPQSAAGVTCLPPHVPELLTASLASSLLASSSLQSAIVIPLKDAIASLCLMLRSALPRQTFMLDFTIFGLPIDYFPCPFPISFMHDMACPSEFLILSHHWSTFNVHLSLILDARFLYLHITYHSA